MSLPDIRLLVPHSGPMVLLDRVIAADDDSLKAEVTIKSNSLFCDGRGVAAWVGVEYMAQAIAAYAGYKGYLSGQPVKVGFLLGTRHYDCTRAFFSVASILQISVRHIFQAENGLASFECTINEANKPVATATLTVFQPDNLDEFL